MNESILVDNSRKRRVGNSAVVFRGPVVRHDFHEVNEYQTIPNSWTSGTIDVHAQNCGLHFSNTGVVLDRLFNLSTLAGQGQNGS